jgi:hypothetical protein
MDAFVKFEVTPGIHRLEGITNGHIGGNYVVAWDGSICIVSIWSVLEGCGHLTQFLNSLPRNLSVEFDNVVSDVLRKALKKRGFVDHTGREDWIRTPRRQQG